MENNNAFLEITNELVEIKSLLLQVLDNQKQTSNFGIEEEFVGVSGASKITKLSPSTIYNLRHNESIPYYKRDGSNKLMFSVSELKEWITNRSDIIPQDGYSQGLIKNQSGRIVAPK